MSTLWPIIESGYPDPEGYIDLDVYNAAGALCDGAESLAVMMLKDEEVGRQLLLKAAARVTEQRLKGGESIRDLKAYLFTTYKNLLKEHLKGLKRTEPYDDQLDAFVAAFGSDAALDDGFAQSAERRMCAEEIFSRMDDWTRKVYRLLVLGYTFKEIAQGRNKSDAVVRSKFHKKLRQLARGLGSTPKSE